MTIVVGIFTYLMLVALVSLTMLYYFKVIQPKDERKLNS